MPMLMVALVVAVVVVVGECIGYGLSLCGCKYHARAIATAIA